LPDVSSLIGQASSSAFVAVRSWLALVWAALVTWSFVLFVIVARDYRDFRLARFDLGNMVQAVWSTAHLRPLEMTDANGDQITRLAVHVDPILVLLAPLWLAVSSPMTLAAAQIGAVALGALPVFWLGRKHLGSERAAAWLALAYLSYPWLAWTALDAVHPVTFAIPLFLYAIWFLDSGRRWPFWICAGLLLSTGELIGLPLAFLGLWFALSRGERRTGLAVAAVGISWTILCLKLVIPAFSGGESRYYERYASAGGSPAGIVRKAFTDPGAIVSALTSNADLSYVLWLAAPLMGMFLLAPALAAVALPQLLLNALSDWSTTTDARHHYIAGVVPFLFAASVVGIQRVPEARRIRVVSLLAAVSGGFGLLLGPWPGLPGEGPIGFHTKLPAAQVAALRQAESLVPHGAPVSATNVAASQLSDRRYVYSVPVLGRAEWVVVETWNSWMPWTPTRPEGRHPEVLAAFLERMKESPGWEEIFDRDGVVVFRRVSS
jgi:uncharacterized membrane protein